MLKHERDGLKSIDYVGISSEVLPKRRKTDRVENVQRLWGYAPVGDQAIFETGATLVYFT